MLDGLLEAPDTVCGTEVTKVEPPEVMVVATSVTEAVVSALPALLVARFGVPVLVK